MTPPDSKKCTKCGEVKLLAMFHRAKSGTHGRRGECKDCVSKIGKINRSPVRAILNEKSRAYHQQKKAEAPEAYRARMKLHSNKFREENPERWKDHYIKRREEVTAGYIATIIKIDVSILLRHPEYIEAKRQQILLKREISKKQNKDE